MSKSTKIWLAVASLLICIGTIIFIVAMSLLNWDFTKLSNKKFHTITHEITEDFTNITITTDISDIEFFYTNDLKATVICKEYEDSPHSITVTDGILKVDANNDTKWYDKISIFSFISPKISVYLPYGEYQELKINSNTGDVKLPNTLSFSTIDVIVDTGDVENYSSSIEHINITTSTGDVKIKRLEERRVG